MAELSTETYPEIKYGVKLLKEIQEKSICLLPLDCFWIDGPNGTHLCLVYPVLGPPVSCLLRRFKYPDTTLRKIALQVVRGVAALHDLGICHGGFFPLVAL